MLKRLVIMIVNRISLLMLFRYFFFVVHSVFMTFSVSWRSILSDAVLAILIPASIVLLSKLSSSSCCLLGNVLVTLGEECVTGREDVWNLEVDVLDGGKGGGSSLSS